MRSAATRTWLLLLAVSLLVGCAFGTTPVAVKHSLLLPSRSQRDGVVLVRPFEDARPEDRRPYIGAKRNTYGIVLGNLALPEGEELPTLLTRYFAHALGKAGYTAVLASDPAAASTPADGILEGVIVGFWEDTYLLTWHNVKIDLRLLRRPGEEVVWQTQVSGSQSHYLWVGSDGEFERVIREALDEALVGAVAAFSSNEFHAALHADRADATR
jgi:hypothetical protein